jgi:hypothetical protein
VKLNPSRALGVGVDAEGLLHLLIGCPVRAKELDMGEENTPERPRLRA